MLEVFVNGWRGKQANGSPSGYDVLKQEWAKSKAREAADERR
jgi:hypothetical protein